MAIDAFVRRVFVDDDFYICDFSRLGVALGARHVCVAAGQRQMGTGVVIKSRGNPALGVVAIRAVSLVILCHELTIVFVLVTGFALCRSAFESGL